MTRQRILCPICQEPVEPLYLQVKNENGKRAFHTSGYYLCKNDGVVKVEKEQ